MYFVNYRKSRILSICSYLPFHYNTVKMTGMYVKHFGDPGKEQIWRVRFIVLRNINKMRLLFQYIPCHFAFVFRVGL